MSFFERTEGEKDNLGLKPRSNFVDVDDLPNDGKTPAELVEELDEMRARRRAVPDVENHMVINQTESDDGFVEKSNWEEDVEAGKYDKGYKPVAPPSFHGQDKLRRSDLGEMTKMEREDLDVHKTLFRTTVKKTEKPREKWGTVNPNKNKAA